MTERNGVELEISFLQNCLIGSVFRKLSLEKSPSLLLVRFLDCKMWGLLVRLLLIWRGVCCVAGLCSLCRGI